MASRVLTMGIGQKSPMQSMCLSGMSTFGSVTMPRYGILGLATPSRWRGGSLTPHGAPANTYQMAKAKRVARPKPDEPTLVAGGARRTIMLAPGRAAPPPGPGPRRPSPGLWGGVGGLLPGPGARGRGGGGPPPRGPAPAPERPR